MNRLANLFQFLIGFLLGVALLLGGTAALAYVFLSKMSASPPKPLFAEEKREQTSKKSTASPSASSQPKTAAENLPPGAYKARVNWAEGLSVRAEPSTEAERLGGVEYKSELIILGTSNDGKWQKVRRSGGTLEGWVRAGNVDKVE